MPKKPPPARIKRHRVYTVHEAAETLGVHRQTVIRWIKNDALEADRQKRPWLIPGSHLRTFLEERRRGGRARLGPGEVFCLPCRRARVPAEGMAEFQMKTPTTGVLVGICPVCERLMHRFVGRTDLDAMRAVVDVTIRQAVAGIVGGGNAPVTATENEARRNHG